MSLSKFKLDIKIYKEEGNRMKIKILFIMTNLCGGGAEKVLVDIINNMDFERFEITLFILRKEGVYLNKLDDRVTVIYDSKNMSNIYSKYLQKRFIKYMPKIFYRLKIKDKFDIEVAFLEGMPTKVLAYSKNKNSKKISWVHIDLLKKHWTKQMYISNKEEENCYNKMNDIVFVSKESKESFEKLFRNNSKKHVVYNPVIDEEILRKSNEINIKYDKFTIVSVGRLDYQKGYDRLLKVHSRLIKKYDYNLMIIGEGPQRIELESLIKELNIQESVELKGFVSNPYVYMKGANLFVSSSRTEGYPLVLLETLVLNKAIVATKITGNNEVLNYGELGIMCEDSEEGLYTELNKILEDKSIVEGIETHLRNIKWKSNYMQKIKEIENILIK